MSIASEVTRIDTNVANAFDSAELKGATMPGVLNSDYLASCIDSIPTGGGGKNASILVRPTSISQGTGYTVWSIPTNNSVQSDAYTTPVAFVFSGMAPITYFWISLGGVNSIVVTPTPYQSTQMPFFARFSASDASGLTLMVRDTTIQLSNTLSFGGLTNPESFTPNIIEVSGVMSAVIGANKTLNIHKLFVRFISEV